MCYFFDVVVKEKSLYSTMANKTKFELLILSIGLLLLAATLPTSSFQLCSNPLVKVAEKNGPLTHLSAEEWAGEVVSNTEDGRIRGCMISPDGETEFTIRIDGWDYCIYHYQLSTMISRYQVSYSFPSDQFNPVSCCRFLRTTTNIIFVNQ